MARLACAALLLLALTSVVYAGVEHEWKPLEIVWTAHPKSGTEYISPDEDKLTLTADEAYTITIGVTGWTDGGYVCPNLYLDWSAGTDDLSSQLELAGLACDEPEDLEGGYAPLGPLDDGTCVVTLHCIASCTKEGGCAPLKATIVEEKDSDYTDISDWVESGHIPGSEIEVCIHCEDPCEPPYGKYTCAEGVPDYECLSKKDRCIGCHMDECSEYSYKLSCDECPVKCPKGYKGGNYKGDKGKGYKAKGGKGYTCTEPREINLYGCKSGAAGYDKKQGKLTCLPKGGGYGYSGPGSYYGKDGAYYKSKYGSGYKGGYKGGDYKQGGTYKQGGDYKANVKYSGA